MITTDLEYQKHLYLIQSNNFPVKAVLIPEEEQIYHIDLNARTIDAPEFLSVERDHLAETVYFRCARYFDNMDLANTVCIIQYVNKNAKNADGAADLGHIYPVPFYDVITYDDEIVFPWCIEGPATEEAGTVEFAITFYLLDQGNTKFIYSLNTQVAKSKVLYGMKVSTDDENENFAFPTDYEILIQEIKDLRDAVNFSWEFTDPNDEWLGNMSKIER